ncbi:MAG: universal stress protein [Gemmatimonadaceae bacterium]|nr:universal stress protein [Gemmatimonadaceae bacterium]
MSTATSSQPYTFAAYHPAPQLVGPIVIASDTSPQSDAAFPAAQALAERTNSVVHVVSAVMPFAMPMYAFDTMPVPLETDLAVREGREGMLKAQQTRLISPTSNWPVMVRTGEPAREIVEFAQDHKARVIVVGRGRHAAIQRALGGETVLRLLQLGDTPVLAAEAKLTAAPRRVVIATDFSEFSLYAAQVALTLVASDAVIYLVHVAPPFSKADQGLQDRAIAYRNQALHGFSQLHEMLARNGFSVEDVLVEGNPSDELTKVIRDKDADLVVTATHGYGFLRRMILGSVAAELLRHAPCSVLCVPGSARTLAAARTRPSTTAHTHTFDMAVLDAELKAFSDRNTGRPCTVEIDSRDLGAQILGHSLPLVGATYDRATRLVSLMFGTSALTGQHLTHTIAEVSAVDTSTGGDGREQVLRLVHTDGQTLVLLE